MKKQPSLPFNTENEATAPGPDAGSPQPDPGSGPTCTSRMASALVRRSGKAERDRCRILDYIRQNGEKTRNELERELGMRINVVCPRVKELLTDTPRRLYVKKETKQDPLSGKDVEVLDIFPATETQDMF